ncbi:malic oxidoreductase [Tanacetum coccineum]
MRRQVDIRCMQSNAGGSLEVDFRQDMASSKTFDALLRKKSSSVPPLEDAASNRFWIRGAWAAISNSVHHSQVIISGKQACKINEVQRRIYILCAKPTRIFGLTWKMPSYYFAFLTKKKTGNDIIFASGSPFKNVDLGNGEIGYCNEGNNMYRFPGIGLGTLLSRARIISDGKLQVAAEWQVRIVQITQENGQSRTNTDTGTERVQKSRKIAINGQ